MSSIKLKKKAFAAHNIDFGGKLPNLAFKSSPRRTGDVPWESAWRKFFRKVGSELAFSEPMSRGMTEEYKAVCRNLPRTQSHSAPTRRFALSNTSTASGRSSQ